MPNLAPQDLDLEPLTKPGQGLALRSLFADEARQDHWLAKKYRLEGVGIW